TPSLGHGRRPGSRSAQPCPSLDPPSLGCPTNLARSPRKVAAGGRSPNVQRGFSVRPPGWVREAPMRRWWIGLIASVFFFAAWSGGGASGTSSGPSSAAAVSPEPPQNLAPLHGTYAPTISPEEFGTIVDNRYWPLTPGTTFFYRGVRGTTPQTNTVT